MFHLVYGMYRRTISSKINQQPWGPTSDDSFSPWGLEEVCFFGTQFPKVWLIFVGCLSRIFCIPPKSGKDPVTVSVDNSDDLYTYTWNIQPLLNDFHQLGNPPKPGLSSCLPQRMPAFPLVFQVLIPRNQGKRWWIWRSRLENRGSSPPGGPRHHL